MVIEGISRTDLEDFKGFGTTTGERKIKKTDGQPFSQSRSPVHPLLLGPLSDLCTYLTSSGIYRISLKSMGQITEYGKGTLSSAPRPPHKPGTPYRLP